MGRVALGAITSGVLQRASAQNGERLLSLPLMDEHDFAVEEVLFPATGEQCFYFPPECFQSVLAIGITAAQVGHDAMLIRGKSGFRQPIQMNFHVIFQCLQTNLFGRGGGFDIRYRAAGQGCPFVLEDVGETQQVVVLAFE